jgi:hypothetical protein
LGVSPSQAPIERDFRKLAGSSIAGANDIAVTVPTLGIDMKI